MSRFELILHFMHIAERVVPGLITCAEADAFIDDYLDARLDGRTARRFERHLATCPPCRDYLEAYRRGIALAGAIADADTPTPPDELLAAILDARRARP